MRRLDYVSVNTRLWISLTHKVLKIEEIERFAATAEEIAHERSRELTDFIKEQGGDLEWLTDHAACMRTLSAKIVLLRGGLVPALKIDKDNPVLRMDAVGAMGYIRSDLEAMLCLMR